MLVAKIAVSIGLLAWIVGYIDREALTARLTGALWPWLLAGFAVKSLTVPLAALRWRAAGAMAGARMGVMDALRVTFASLFLGQALPGAVGGDIVRGWLTTRLGFGVAAVVLALVVDRLAALLGVAALMLAGLPHLSGFAPPGAQPLVLGAAAAMCLGTAALLFADRIPLPRWLRRPAIEAMRDLIAGMRGRFGAVAGGQALLYSVGVHFCTVVAAALFAHALGAPVSLLDCLAVVPFSIVAASLPVSLAGWGVREGAMVAGFSLLGLAAADGVALSLLIGLSVLVMALPGAVVWLSWRPGAVPSSPLAHKITS